MREYIEKKLDYLRRELDAHLELYKECLHDLRKTAERDLPDEAISDMTWGREVEPSDIHQITWIDGRLRNVKDRGMHLRILQEQYKVCMDFAEEIAKYESPGTVTMDDAARTIAREAASRTHKAATIRMKKDEEAKQFHLGAAKAGMDALKALGYTDEQIEEMTK